MEHRTRDLGGEAIRRLEALLGAGPEVGHDDVQAAVTCVAAFRNAVIADLRGGRADRDCLDRANALVSLAYGAEFPLTGFHLHRFEQTRDGLKALVASG